MKYTEDLEQFSLLDNNRDIDLRHVAKLQDQIGNGHNYLHLNPITVNEKMQIINGQHRWQAAKNLKIGIYYLIGDGMGPKDAACDSLLTKNWKPLDYIKSYAAEGNENYIKLLKLINEASHINHASIIDIMRRGGGNINDGTFVFKAEQKTRVVWIDAVVGKFPQKKISAGRVSRALYKLMISKKITFDRRRMMKACTDYGAAMAYKTSTVDQAIEMLEGIYNFHLSDKNRVAFRIITK